MVFYASVLFILLACIIAQDGSYEYVSAKTCKTVIVIAEIACICGCLLLDGVWAPGLWTATIAVVSIVYLNKQDRIHKDSNQTQRTTQTTARTTSTRNASTSRTYASTPSTTTPSTATPASSITLNPEVFRYGGRDRDLYMNACWHDGKVYCGKTPSPDRIIGYYDEKESDINCLGNHSIGHFSESTNGQIVIWFSTLAIYFRMREMGKKSSTPDPDGKLVEIINVNNTKYKHITDTKTVTWVADYQGNPRGAVAAFVCLIYEMHRGEIDSKYSRFYTDYINSFH